MAKKTNSVMRRVFWGSVKTFLISFLIYLATWNLLTAIFYADVPPGTRDFTPIYIVMALYFGISFYFVYTPRYFRENEILPEKFDWKCNLSEFFSRDGKYILIVYAVLAVINEFAIWMGFVTLLTTLGIGFPISAAIPIPILRSAVAYIVTMTLITVATLLKYYRIYRILKKK